MPSATSRNNARRSSGKLHFRGQAGPGFTLIEILVVVGIMVLMLSLAVPAFNAIRGGTDFTSEVYSVAGAYQQARAYAVANNTYVLAGIAEVAAGQSSSVRPQASGTGTVVIAMVASNSGTRPYQSLFPSSLNTWSTVYNTGGAFAPVGKLLVFNNLHIVDLQGTGVTPPTSGPMARPAVEQAYDLSYGDPSAQNYNTQFYTQFAWPLGVKFTGTPKPQYIFVKVIEFDPQGSARVISSLNTASFPNAVPQYIEVGLQPAHGAAAAGPPADQTTNAGQIAAIQVNGICGAVDIYRP